jgi:hypothetical protein
MRIGMEFCKQKSLDRDLAELYGVKALRLREQVKRSLNRFPKNLMPHPNEKEMQERVSHFAIPSKIHKQNRYDRI